jgi:hypothetical protein
MHFFFLPGLAGRMVVVDQHIVLSLGEGDV